MSSQLQPVAEDVWRVDRLLVLGGLLHFPARMTVVRLPSGGLWLHSPLPIDDDLAAALAALGPVEHLVAPNRLHHLHMGAAIERYPEARVWGAPGLAAKRPDLRLDDTLGASAASAWGDALEIAAVEGNDWVSESVFLHRPSKTLVVTDLVFNIQASASWFTRAVLWSVGAWRRPAQSKVWRLTTRDRGAAARSVGRVLGWDFDRVIPAHGAVLEANARSALTGTLAWMRGGAALVGAGGDSPLSTPG